MIGTKLFLSLETPRRLTLCHEFSICLVGSFVAQMVRGAGGSSCSGLNKDEWAFIRGCRDDGNMQGVG